MHFPYFKRLIVREETTNMEINIPDVLLDLTKAFNQYEEALLSNQPEILNELFWRSPLTIRYGVAENLYGYDAIVGYRNTRASQGGAPPRRDEENGGNDLRTRFWHDEHRVCQNAKRSQGPSKSDLGTNRGWLEDRRSGCTLLADKD